MKNTNNSRGKDSKAKAISLCGQENVGPTLTTSEQDVLQMLVNSNDNMKALYVDQISAEGWAFDLNTFSVLTEI